MTGPGLEPDVAARLAWMGRVRVRADLHTPTERRVVADAEQHCRDDGHQSLHEGRCVGCGLVPRARPDDGWVREMRLLAERAAARRAENGPVPEPNVAPLPHPRKVSTLPASARTVEQLRGDWTDRDPTQTAALDAAAAWVARQRSANPSYRGLLLTGPPGTGKTSIVQAVAVALPDAHHIDVRELYAALHAEMGGAGESTADRLARARVLVLDDLGAARDTDWRLDELRGLIERRHARGGLMVATSNLSEPDLAGWLGARAWGRLRERVDVHPVLGPDRRVDPGGAVTVHRRSSGDPDAHISRSSR